MSDRLNVVFHQQENGDPYALLSLKGDLEVLQGDDIRNLNLDTAFVRKALLRLTDSLEEHERTQEPSISAAAVQLTCDLSQHAILADLLPHTAPWLADLTVHVTVKGGEFHLSCETMNLGLLDEQFALELTAKQEDELLDAADPLDALNRFEGSVAELRSRVLELVPTLDESATVAVSKVTDRPPSTDPLKIAI